MDVVRKYHQNREIRCHWSAKALIYPLSPYWKIKPVFLSASFSVYHLQGADKTVWTFCIRDKSFITRRGMFPAPSLNYPAFIPTILPKTALDFPSTSSPVKLPILSIYYKIPLSYSLHTADEPHSALLLLLPPPAFCSQQLSPSSFWGPAFLSRRATCTGVTVPGACGATCLWLGKIPNQPIVLPTPSHSLPPTGYLIGTAGHGVCAGDVSRCDVKPRLLLWGDIPLWGTHPHKCMSRFQHSNSLMSAQLLAPSPIGVLAVMQDLAHTRCETNKATQQ